MQITDSHIDFSNHIKSKGMMILDNPKIAASQLIYRLIAQKLSGKNIDKLNRPQSQYDFSVIFQV